MAKTKSKNISNTSSQSLNPGIWMVVSFFIVLVVNMFIIHLANNFYPYNVVLGTMSIPRMWAIILNASVIALTTTFLMPFINQAESLVSRSWSPAELMGVYLIINFVTVWLLGRVAEIFGLGVSSWFVVLLLSIVLDCVQGVVMMGVEKFRSN